MPVRILNRWMPRKFPHMSTRRTQRIQKSQNLSSVRRDRRATNHSAGLTATGVLRHESIMFGLRAGNSSILYPMRARFGPPSRVYSLVRGFWRFAFFWTMRVRVAGLENVPNSGGCILAVAHVSHTDPLVVSALTTCKISWMSRVEFYHNPIARILLDAVGAFPVDRKKPGLYPIREAMRRLERRGVVGIFPEGEIVNGPDSVCRGGPIKAGAMYLSALTGCPVVPILVLGTDKLSSPGPWLPARRGRLWLRVGMPITADASERHRTGRAAASQRLARAFQELFQSSRATWNLPDDILP